MLYLIATPIGNLKDISLRALEVLGECDYVLCEDTRKTSILLNHHEIKKKLVSYHLFSESAKLEGILEDLRNGLSIGLVSDGGSPALCDPGERLTAACAKEDLPMTSIPGPVAFIQALLLSGLETTPLQFLGFMPKKEAQIKALLPSVFSYPGNSIFYESPRRLTQTLELIVELRPEVQVAIARELTKTYEEIVRLSAKEALEHFTKEPPRGEIVLIIKGEEKDYSSKDPKELVEELTKVYGLSLTQAIKTAAHLLERPKQSIYQLYH